MIRGEEVWRAEYDRIVGDFRKLNPEVIGLTGINEARAKAIAELRKLHLTIGQAIAALAGRKR